MGFIEKLDDKRTRQHSLRTVLNVILWLNRTTFAEHVESKYGWEVKIRQKPASAKGFVPGKNRFGWLNFRRRLAKEYEKTVESAEAMLQVAFHLFPAKQDKIL